MSIADRRAHAARLYLDDGLSLRAVGAALDPPCSHEGARLLLISAGVHLRDRGVPNGPKAIPLEAEILADLTGHFGGTATIADLVDWLGEDREAVTDALLALTARGKINYADGRAQAVARPARTPKAIPSAPRSLKAPVAQPESGEPTPQKRALNFDRKRNAPPAKACADRESVAGPCRSGDALKPITSAITRWARAFAAAGWDVAIVADLFGVDDSDLRDRLAVLP